MATREIEPIYWNVNNKSFGQNYTRHVQMQEKMDIFCPRRSDSDSNHFQSVFLVDEEGFNLCRQNEKSKKIMTCSDPDLEKKYTIIFQEVNPNPWGLEFDANKAYYIISTSMGPDENGLGNTSGGLCSTHSMKLKLFVHPGDSDGVQRINTLDDQEEAFADFSEGGNGVVGANRKGNFYEIYEAYEESIKTENIPVKKQEKKFFSMTMMVAGIVLGVFLIIFMLLIGFLTRRAIESRKRSDSFPTLSDYHSSTIEKTYNSIPQQNFTQIPVNHPVINHPIAHHSSHAYGLNSNYPAIVPVMPSNEAQARGNSDIVYIPDMGRYVQGQLRPLENTSSTLKSAASEFRYIDVAKIVSNRENGTFIAH